MANEIEEIISVTPMNPLITLFHWDSFGDFCTNQPEKMAYMSSITSLNSQKHI
jgi:hypothetical protein